MSRQKKTNKPTKTSISDFHAENQAQKRARRSRGKGDHGAAVAVRKMEPWQQSLEPALPELSAAAPRYPRFKPSRCKDTCSTQSPPSRQTLQQLERVLCVGHLRSSVILFKPFYLARAQKSAPKWRYIIIWVLPKKDDFFFLSLQSFKQTAVKPNENFPACLSYT